MSACLDKELLLNALADGELDAGNVLSLEAHVAGCAGCADELAAIRAVKARLAADAPAYAAPASLRAKLDAAFSETEAPASRRRRVGLQTWIASGAAAALAASLALFALVPSGDSLESQLVDAQVRSLQAQHLVDVATSDRHTVKPWFNGKIDFAPPVVDLASEGFPLVGGRLDRVGGRQAAALVFRRRAHVINLFIWRGDGSSGPGMERKQGYALVRWSAGGLTFWAVSDVDPPDLLRFRQAFVAATK